jgi:glutaredoxin 2
MWLESGSYHALSQSCVLCLRKVEIELKQQKGIVMELRDHITQLENLLEMEACARKSALADHQVITFPLYKRHTLREF